MTTTTNGTAEVTLEGASQEAPPARMAPLAFPTRAILPLFVFAVGVGGLFLLPNHLVFAGSTALWYGLIGLATYLPLVALRELSLHGGAVAGWSAYLFAKVAQNGWFGIGEGGGAKGMVLGIIAGLTIAVVVNVIVGCASLLVTGLYFTVSSLVVQIG
ncbi:MAG: hypothetical protein ACREJF_04570, partial [Candidatus Methylomirabilales bacterium]